jgi:hypothetical protein
MAVGKWIFNGQASAILPGPFLYNDFKMECRKP